MAAVWVAFQSATKAPKPVTIAAGGLADGDGEAPAVGGNCDGVGWGEGVVDGEACVGGDGVGVAFGLTTAATEPGTVDWGGAVAANAISPPTASTVIAVTTIFTGRVQAVSQVKRMPTGKHTRSPSPTLHQRAHRQPVRRLGRELGPGTGGGAGAADGSAAGGAVGAWLAGTHSEPVHHHWLSLENFGSRPVPESEIRNLPVSSLVLTELDFPARNRVSDFSSD